MGVIYNRMAKGEELSLTQCTFLNTEMRRAVYDNFDEESAHAFEGDVEAVVEPMCKDVIEKHEKVMEGELMTVVEEKGLSEGAAGGLKEFFNANRMEFAVVESGIANAKGGKAGVEACAIMEGSSEGIKHFEHFKGQEWANEAIDAFNGWINGHMSESC